MLSLDTSSLSGSVSLLSAYPHLLVVCVMSSAVVISGVMDRLPFDVWVAVAAHLPMKDILCLRLVCRDLYDMMGEWVVWSLALADILEVVHLPFLQHTMHMMSSIELRQKAILVARVDCLLDRDVIEPANVQSYPTGADVTQASIAPGGEGIMLMYDDGTLHVHKTRNLAHSEPLVVPRPNCMAGSIHNPFPTLVLSSSGKYHLALACDRYTNTKYVFPTVTFRIFLNATVVDNNLSFVFFASTLTHRLSSF